MRSEPCAFHSRPQSLRSFWPAAGIERLWEQPLKACAIDEDFVKPDGQNSVISFVISKWLLPELSIPAAGQKDRRLWVRECVLSCHGFRFLLIFFRFLLGYLKDCNVAAHSVNSDIFYVVINLSAGSKSYIITFIS